MEKMTITEALAELKLIDAKVLKKKAFVESNLMSVGHLPDPFKNDGGVTAKLTSEVQAISDLNKKKQRIREAIAEANVDTRITVGEQTQSISQWLAWKREIAKDQIQFIKNIHTKIKQELDQAARQPRVFQDEETKETKIVKVTPNLDYGFYVKQEEILSDTYEKLDGQLSLKNATIVITI